MTADRRRVRVRVRVRGTVQGVGFRPYVFRLASELGLTGWVLNDERGVVLEAQGDGGAVEELIRRLPADAPPLAEVEAVEVAAARPTEEPGFRIADSVGGGEPEALVSPDTATCADCLRELFDPADRRHRYPFINCTNCGPRFTIVQGVPYDRPQTTMAAFVMCDACQAEYEDPRDRRFHAQPNACPDCGPRARLVGRAARDPIATAAELLGSGSILAVKGLGGYHLACRADHDEAVSALRARKHREDKPFALMARDLGTAAELVELAPADETLLSGPERPIVIARRREGAAVAAAVAPRTRDLGVMLPYTPLHHLLLADATATLVMTSGNLSDEPIAFADEDASSRLGEIADAFLVHDRPIHIRTDDSVARSLRPATSDAPLLIRRSRGYAPRSTPLPANATRPILACGAELKSTFCVAKGARAWVSHHIGDLKNWETLESFRDGIAHFERLFAVVPEVVAHDLHPDYLSTKHALERDGVERVAVQHHHAHLAACLAEHGAEGPAVGAIYDGTGLGPDGTVWGGEILAGGLEGFARRGLLFPVRLPGGDRAALEPWRMACAWLVATTGEEVPGIPAALAGEVEPESWEAICDLIPTGLNSPPTTSAGRLFDAVSALCGIRAAVTYEGQAAAELEGLADPAETGAYPMPLIDAGNGHGAGAVILDARETVRALVGDLRDGAAKEIVAARFHNGLGRATAAALTQECEAAGVDLAVLSGGVFQNRLLLERTAALLREASVRVLIPQRLPPNDGGISYGQAAIAAATTG
ncbi:MAG: carbamoyltransferase HypF [Solirubrobacterales bacterium]